MPPYAAKGSPAIASSTASLAEGGDRRTAGVGVLDDAGSDAIWSDASEGEGELLSRIGVEDVVVTEFLAVQLLGGGQPSRAGCADLARTR
jgi:hypothetical protein